jgi:hypothetical protein
LFAVFFVYFVAGIERTGGSVPSSGGSDLLSPFRFSNLTLFLMPKLLSCFHFQ